MKRLARRVVNRRNPRWSSTVRLKFQQNHRNSRNKRNRARYRKVNRVEKQLLQEVNYLTLDWCKPVPKSRRVCQWLYRQVLPIMYHRLFCPLDRFILDGIEHMLYAYLSITHWLCGNVKVNRLAHCAPWRNVRLKQLGEFS